MPKARINGIDISYKVEGAGEPLVLIMGFSGDRRAWILHKRALGKRFQTITFDNRGAGKTDKPSEPYTIKTMADDTVGLMDHLGIERAHVLGVSMGGMIAQEVAINYPERVRKLVMGCTFARRDDVSGHSAEYYRSLGLEEGCSDDDLRIVTMTRLMGTVYSLASNNRLVQMIAGPVAKIRFRSGRDQGVKGQYEAILSHDTQDRLHMIQAPTLVITGAGDRLITPRSSDVLASNIPNARLVKVEGGAHAFFVEKCFRFNREVLDFLSAG
ncbi:alpha/beta fold hydrolase [Chloroflexota bacterium]